VEGYMGSFYKPPNSPTDVYLPAIDCDKAFIAKLNIMEKLNPSNEVRFRRNSYEARNSVQLGYGSCVVSGCAAVVERLLAPLCLVV
jgi:hypothetical protein